MRVLAEIPVRSSSPQLRAGTLRRCDLEAFDRLLDRLHDKRTVQLTGREGKREAAVGLATAATIRGLRTLLLEGDLARPALADTLGLANAPGLSEFLRGEVEAPRILQSLILAGPASEAAGEPLVCVVAGRPSTDGPALLGSEAFNRAVGGLSAAYELVVVDGPLLDDEHSLAAVAARVDTTLALCPQAEVPKSLQGYIDGLVRPEPVG